MADSGITFNQYAEDMFYKANMDLSNTANVELGKFYLFPDYSAQIKAGLNVDITLEFPVLARLSGGQNGTGKVIKINGLEVSGAYVNSTTSTDILAVAKKGDVLHFQGPGTYPCYYPLKGAQ